MLAVALHGWAAHGAVVDVDIMNFTFIPDPVTVQAGDTVRWTQHDTVQHSTTSGTTTGGTRHPDGLWDSGLMGQGQSFSHTFDAAGTFPYYCIPHFTFMTGTVIVMGGGGGNPPTVDLVSPTDGASFSSGTNITIQATASSSGGSISQVEFFDGANSLGTSATSPYSVTVDLSPGSHTLTAVATDDQGLSATSSSVMVSVSSAPIDDPIPERIAKGDLAIELQPVMAGLVSPLGMAVPDDGSGRMFVYDQAGWVWVMDAGGKQPAPLLNVHDRLVPLGAYDERGLLGFATHPDFAEHPLVYTYTSEPGAGAADFSPVLAAGETNNHQSVIAEWRLDSSNTNLVDPSSRRELMRIDEPEANHNAGTLRFGPDGFLYVSLGDGGAADDQGAGHVDGGNAQDTGNIYGSIIRIDVDGSNSGNGRYGVPSDNPFIGQAGVDEIYAYGLRNPYNYSFDRLNGELYLADVGQNKIEEIDEIIKGGNYGWHVKEGTFFFDPNGDQAGFVTSAPVGPVPPDLIDPIAEYDHDEGSAVVGGFVYRGSQIPALAGHYVFGDWGTFGQPSGRLFYLDTNDVIKEFRIGGDDRPLGMWLKGFGEDANGELYVFGSRDLGPHGNSGRMLRILQVPPAVQIAQASTGEGTNLLANWTGGLGPFAWQTKSSLAAPMWENEGFTAGTDIVSPIDEEAAFFRVADVAHQPAIPLTVFLSGLNERPDPLTNSASGSGTLSLDGNVLSFEIAYGGLSGPATAAHIHGPAGTDTSVGVLISLAPYNGEGFGTNGTFSGSVVLTPEQQAMVLAGRTYVNVHTSSNPGGEMRGQIAPVLMQATFHEEEEGSEEDAESAGGTGLFALAGNQLSFNITYHGLSGPATGAHIHGPADESESAGILIGLESFNGGAFGTNGVFDGTVTLTPEQLGWVIDGKTYVNIHTMAYPGGEIRGQILPQSTAVPMTAMLSGLNERPTPLTNNAAGSGIFALQGTNLVFEIHYAGLSGPATAAHIHGPASADESAGIVISLVPFNGGSFGTNGSLSGAVGVTPEQRDMLLNGKSYVNVHTAQNSGGEMRGQIAPVLMQASLSGVNERPDAVTTEGSGSGLFALVKDQLTFNLTYRDLSGPASASHIHGPASSSQSTGVLLSLEPYNGGAYGSSGALAGTAPLGLDILAHLIDGLTYVNFHTSAHSGGEMRGQITR